MSTKTGGLLLAAVLQTLLWIAVLCADPFGMSSAADRASEDIFLRLYPYFYPGTDKRIEVVLIDEKQLPFKPNAATPKEEWPPSYEEFADLIGQVLAHKPKAVFVDILFDTGAGDAQPLRDLIAGLKPDGPPVVFADYNIPGKEMLDTIRGLPFENKKALRGIVELTARPNHYMLGTGNGGAASPAAVLYNATVPQKLNVSDKGDFLVAWGNTVDPVEAADPTCAPILSDSVASRFAALENAVMAGLRGFVGSALEGAKSWERMQPCPYHPEFHPRQLYRGDLQTADAQLEGAYVLIGANIAGTNDTVNSPVHGQLPGVFLHAMALDNLLAFKGPPFIERPWPQLLQAFLIFLISFGGGLLFADRGTPESRPAAAGSLVVSTVAFAAALFLIAAILLLFLRTYQLAPYNWGGVAAIAFAVFFSRGPMDLFVLLFGPKSK